jgi:S-adenosylmethionine hydrolase
LTRRVVIISDCTDLAFAEMRGAILQGSGDIDVVIEPLVPTAPFSVINAAFALRLMADAYPPGTVLSVIMNSLRERTERIVGRTKTKDLVINSANTGTLGWLLDDFGTAELYELNDPGFFPFGGKYVHAPAIGRFLEGAALADLGTSFPLEKVRPTPIGRGTVVHVDNFGNIKFAWGDLNLSFGERLSARINSMSLEVVWWRRMMERQDGEWVLYPGSSWDLLEIGQVRGPGFTRMSVRPGDVVQLSPQRVKPLASGPYL